MSGSRSVAKPRGLATDCKGLGVLRAKVRALASSLGASFWAKRSLNSGCSPNRRTNPSISRDRRAECSATMIVSTSVPSLVPPARRAGGLGKGTEVLTIMVAEHSARLSRLCGAISRRFGLHALVYSTPPPAHKLIVRSFRRRRRRRAASSRSLARSNGCQIQRPSPSKLRTRFFIYKTVCTI